MAYKANIPWKALLLLSWVLIFSVYPQAQNQSSQDAKSQVVVRIYPNHHRFYPGEDVHLRIEIWNEGEKDIFVSKDISTINNALAKINLDLYYNDQIIGPKTAVYADCFCSQRPNYPPLSTELPRYWITLSAKHFYEGEVVLSLASLKKPKVPGRYLIKGKYSSRGFLPEDINNPLLHYAEELKQLPYEAWVGEVETNPVWIEIAN